MPKPSQYVEFLNLLLSFGPKLPAILEDIEIIVNTVSERIDHIRTILGTPTPLKADRPEEFEEVTILEGRVMELALEGRSAGPFQRVLDFIKNNPELLQIVLLLLK